MNPFIAMTPWNTITPWNTPFSTFGGPSFAGSFQTPSPWNCTPNTFNGFGGWNSTPYSQWLNSPVQNTFGAPINGWNPGATFGGFNGGNTFGSFTTPFTSNLWNGLNTPSFGGAGQFGWTPNLGVNTGVYGQSFGQGFSPIAGWNTPFANTFGATTPYGWTTPNAFGWFNPNFSANGQNGYSTVNPMNVNGYNGNPFVGNGQNVGVNNPMQREAA